MSADRSATIFCGTPRRVPLDTGRTTPPLPGAASAQPAPAPPCSAPPLPTGPCPLCPRLAQEFEPYRQAAYWKARHQRGLQREAELQQRVAALEAQLRLRDQQLFGRKTETKAAGTAPAPATAPAPPRPRG